MVALLLLLLLGGSDEVVPSTSSNPSFSSPSFFSRLITANSSYSAASRRVRTVKAGARWIAMNPVCSREGFASTIAAAREGRSKPMKGWERIAERSTRLI